MRIKVSTKHELYNIQTGKNHYYDEDFYFNYDNNIISIEGSSWKKHVKDMEEGLDQIKKYFYGSKYHIVDLTRMLN